MVKFWRHGHPAARDLRVTELGCPAGSLDSSFRHSSSRDWGRGGAFEKPRDDFKDRVLKAPVGSGAMLD